ncbi:MAG: PcfJ domain-containing protein [Deinococcus sp.]|uniref:PcfJ domain-containing protein n=1 Tax=Deinococcus sp. TaxID=47478 RepID=UPI0026DB5876|nr:PcfJ domain-containing protein [Deinococcus sp.]MDO4246382.1 PcfJ domain-containing protein [Deinococcus sp.]
MTLTHHTPAPLLPLRPLNHFTAPSHAEAEVLRAGFCSAQVLAARSPVLKVQAALDLLAQRNRRRISECCHAALLEEAQANGEAWVKQLPERARTRVLSGNALERDLERFQTRHVGVRRTLWCLTWTDSRAEGEVAALWIRHSSGWLQRVLLNREDVPTKAGVPEEAWDWRQFMQDAGRPDEWSDLTRAAYLRLVRPHLHPDQEADMLKVSAYGYTLSETSEVRDHPFTEGVREFYHLKTEYVLSHTAPDGQGAPARYAKFSCVQMTFRAQWNGRRMLVLSGGKLNDVSYGRLPDDLNDHTQLRGLLELAQEAAQSLRPGEQADLKRTLSQLAPGLREEVSLTLLAVRCPELLSIPGLFLRVPSLSAPAYRRFLRRRPGAKALLADLCGPLTRWTRGQLQCAEQVRLLESLFQSGVQGPEMMARALRAVPHGVFSVTACPEYVQRAGGEALIRGLEQEGSRGLELARDAGRMWKEVQVAWPEFRPKAKAVRQLHDELSRLQRRLANVNLPLESATQQRYDRLDQTLGGLTFRRAGDTHELIAAGEDLDICVGSYRHMAFRGECVIVLARDEGGKLRFCLEVRGQELRQFKGACNARPQGDDLTLALKYAKAARLKVRTSDLTADAGEALPF